MSDERDIFISHSHADLSEAKRLAHEWEAWDYTVYADFKDPVLVRASRRNVMTAKLAERLRVAIRSCRVFVYLLSEHSMTSGWMPWELGLAHGAVGRVHLYLLDAAAQTAPREYLELYRTSSFGEANARTYLRRVVARARAEAIKPTEGEDVRESVERAIAAAQASDFGALQRELTQAPLERGGVTLDVTREKLPTISSTTSLGFRR